MHLAEQFKGCIQSANTKSHNRNLEGLLYKQLNDLILCLSFGAISPIQARVIVMCSLDYAISSFALLISLCGQCYM